MAGENEGGPSRDEVERIGKIPNFGPDRERVGPDEKFKPVSEFDLIGTLTPSALDTLYTTNQKMNEMVESSKDPTQKAPEKKSTASRDNYQPNALVRKFLAEADAEAIRKGYVPASDDVAEEDLRQIEAFANAPGGELVPPEQFFTEVETLPVSYEMTAGIILTLAPMPVHIQDRLRKNPEADLTSNDLTEIYKGISKKLEKDPKTAKLEDLSLIIDTEITGILKEHEKSGIDIDVSGMYTDPTVVKLNTLAKCETAIDKMRAGKVVEPTSEEAEALDDYLRKKIKTFTKLINDKKTPEAVALAKACIAYFGSLHDQTFDTSKNKKVKKKKKKD